MDTLHTMLRSLRSETKTRTDHLAVFREFLDHLDRIGKRSKRPPAPKRIKPPRRSSRR